MRRSLAIFALTLTLGQGVASAQGPAQQPAATTPTASTPALPGANANEAPAAPLPYLFAAIFTIVTLTILCMPTRKA
jgi:hypothetical protein